MTAAHTPGPWQIEEGHIQRDSGGIRYWQVTDGQDAIACNQFCYAGYNPEVNAANARLIAAAPELLAHLKYAVKLLEALPGFRGTAQVDAMQAAIAKAIGAA